MKKAIVVNIEKGHFDFMANELLNLYDPFSFLFIGPTGYYVRQISDKFIEKYNKAINRDAFRVINQYVVETLLQNDMNAVFFDRDFFKAFIAQKIEEYSKIKDYDSDYQEFLRIVSKSNGILEYILDLFEKAWEMQNSTSSSKLPVYYSEINELLLKDGNVSRLINTLLKDISITLQSSESVYDPTTSYKWYVENARYVEQKRKTLVVSGFFDITPILREVLKTMFNYFDDVYFYVWQKVDDRAFNQLELIYEFLDENGFEVIGKDKKPIKINLKSKTKVFGYKNVVSEIYNVCGKVKKLILFGTSPSNIAIVVPNNKVARQVAEKLEEINVPYNISVTSKLSESKIVKIILQPFKTKYFGYDVEDVLTLIETPFIDTNGLTMDQIESLFKEFNIEDGKFIKEEIISRIQRKIDDFNKVEDEDVLEEILERKEEYERFKNVISSVFDLFDEVDKGIKDNFLLFLKRFIKERFVDKFDVFKNREYLDDIQEEINALYKFSEIIDKLLEYNMNISSWRSMFKILTSIINAENYRLAPRKEHSVDIFDISVARFVEKEHKFIIDAIDNYYPSFNVNPLILQTLSDPNKLKAFNEEVERRNFVLSLIFSGENVITYPLSSLSGEPIVPSIYATEFGVVEEVDSKNYVIPPAELIFSEDDKRLYEIFSLNEKLRFNKNEWQDKVEVKRLSHSRISDYVRCPFYYYLKHIAKIRNYNKDKSALYKGILYHRVLKEYFAGLVIDKRRIRELVEKVYDEIYVDEFDRYKIPREMNVDKYVKTLTEFVELIEASPYIKINSEKQLEVKSMWKFEEQYKVDEIFGRNISFDARIDRIDVLNNNYTEFVVENSKEVNNNIMESEKKAYSIIDYKTSIGNTKLIEQLLLYDYAFRKHQKGDFDTYLVFLGIEKKSSSSRTYFLKREENYLYLKGRGKGIRYKKIPYEYFKEWIDEILENIENGIFEPIFSLENERPKNFWNYLMDKKSIVLSKNNDYVCSINNGTIKCDYYDICKNFEIYEGIKLVGN